MDILDKILDEAGLTLTDTWSKRSKYTYAKVLLALAMCPSMKEAASTLNITEDCLEHIVQRNIRKVFDTKPYKVKWNNYLLSLSSNKHCTGCNTILSIEHFVVDNSSWDKLSNSCKCCKAIHRKSFTDNNPEYAKEHYEQHKAEYITRAIQYKTRRTLATPPWANLQEIKRIYDECPEGYHVDHIIPLQGELVSGLHVENNLRAIPALDNLRKHNKFDIE